MFVRVVETRALLTNLSHYTLINLLLYCLCIDIRCTDKLPLICSRM